MPGLPYLLARPQLRKKFGEASPTDWETGLHDAMKGRVMAVEEKPSIQTSVETVLITCGTMKTDTAMTMRITRPQTARPVAASAGFRFSTVSVKLAIHGA